MLKETALVNLHKELGGKLVDFGGWNMPLHYGSQLQEHHAVRQSAGMFDVSHMTVVDVYGEHAKTYLQRVLSNDVDKLKKPGKALYTAMLNEQGGVIDDLIVYLTADGYRLVVNCATREKDLEWMQTNIQGFNVSVKERPELALIAVQGPEARTKVHSLLNAPELEDLDVFFGAGVNVNGVSYFVARTGYTGEDGYEIMLPSEHAESFMRSLLNAGVSPCGLGARDTLRLEAGMNLYGHEMDDDTSPLEANMAWTISWQPEDRDFIGRSALEAQKESGIANKLMGLVIQGKGVLRAGQEVLCAGKDGHGVVTSGTFSPTLGTSVALARVPLAFDGACEVLIRNKPVAVSAVKPQFVRNGQSLL